MPDDIEKTSSEESSGSSGGLSDHELAELEAALFGTGIPDAPPKKKDDPKPPKAQKPEPEPVPEPAPPSEIQQNNDDAASKHHKAVEDEIDSINEVLAPEMDGESPADEIADSLEEIQSALADAVSETQEKTSSNIGVDSDTLNELEEALKQAESDMSVSDDDSSPVPEEIQPAPPEDIPEGDVPVSDEAISEIEAALMQSSADEDSETSAVAAANDDDDMDIPDDSIEVITVISKRKIPKKAVFIAGAVILVPIVLYGIYRITAGIAVMFFSKKPAVVTPAAQEKKEEPDGTIIVPGKSKKGVAYVQEGTELEIDGSLSAKELREKVKKGLMMPSDTKEIRVSDTGDTAVSAGRKTTLKGVVSENNEYTAENTRGADQKNQNPNTFNSSKSSDSRAITPKITRDNFLSAEIDKKRAYYTRPYKNGYKVKELKTRVGLEELFESDYIFLVREELENHSLEDCYELMLVEFPDGKRKYIDSKFYIPITIDGDEIIYDSREAFIHRLEAEK